jgi:putative membrane protein
MVVAAASSAEGRLLAFHLHPDVWLVMSALGIGYWWALTRLGPRVVPQGQEIASRRMKVWWYTGLALTWACAEWPIHDLAEHFSYAVHMGEHLMFTLVCAPVMLLGLPPWLVRWLVVDRPWFKPVRFICRPLPALVLNALMLGLTHWPAVVDETTHNEWFHFGVHLALFGSALALFMPIINRVPELPRLSRPGAILYLFFQSMAPIPPTLWLVFSQTVLYKAYLPGLAYLGWSPTGDQEVAGSLMGVVTPLMLWGVMAYLFFKWAADEAKADLPENLTWRDVERELTGPRW